MATLLTLIVMACALAGALIGYRLTKSTIGAVLFGAGAYIVGAVATFFGACLVFLP